MGLLEGSYGSGHQSEEMLASFWNPQRLKNNGILVSVGFLLGMNAKHLSDLLKVKLPQFVKGLGVGQMELILGGVPGCHPVVFLFDQPITPRRRHSPRDQQRKAMRILGRWIRKYGGQPFAIGYQRANGTGHCVVAKSTHTRVMDDIQSHTFWCYQTQTRGVDMTKDVRKSFIRFAIFIDPRKPAMKMDFFYGTTLPGSVSHVQVVENGWYPAATSTTAAYAPASGQSSNSYAQSGYQSPNGSAYYTAPHPASGTLPQAGYKSEYTQASDPYD